MKTIELARKILDALDGADCIVALAALDCARLAVTTETDQYGPGVFKVQGRLADAN